jgi:hypothetical protein
MMCNDVILRWMHEDVEIERTDFRPHVVGSIEDELGSETAAVTSSGSGPVTLHRYFVFPRPGGNKRIFPVIIT